MILLIARYIRINLCIKRSLRVLGPKIWDNLPAHVSP